MGDQTENIIRIRDYVGIARPDHWLKNAFMLPGAAMAFIIDDRAQMTAAAIFVAGIISACLLASANYTINEYLDGKFDRHHPTKSSRPAAQGKIRLDLVLVQYVILAGAGLAIASQLNPVFFFASLLLLFMGIVYNVEPIRTKDKVFLDVLSESVNNPIRLILGWAAITTIVMPPSSLLICYWAGGAYLMTVKRYAEYRMIADAERAGLYRKSFRHYTEQRLLLAAFFYALTSVFFLAIFLIKYRIEFVISFPFFAFLFVWYLKIASQPTSLAINPEKIYRNRPFLIYVGFLTLLMAGLFFIEMPALEFLIDHNVAEDFRLE